MTDLFPFQEEGVKFLVSRRRALLLDEPGLGKTLQAIRANDMLEHDGMNVICPASVRTQWRHAYANDSINRRDFASYSYEEARSRGVQARSCLVLDEQHFLKNAASKRTRKILGTRCYGRDGLVADALYVWGLTGTPMPKDASDLYAPLFALVPGALGVNGKTMSYWQYVKHFCKTRPGSGFGGSLQIYGSKNLEELKDRIAPYCLRRTKAEVFPQWSKPVIAELWLEAGDAMRGLDESPEGRMMRAAFISGGIDALSVLSDSIATVRRYMGLAIVGALAEWLLEADLKKVVVVCFHREVIAKLKDELTQAQMETIIYQGGMNDEAKSHIKQTFITQENVRVLLLQIGAGGTGLDGLQSVCCDMVFAEYSWIDDENKQAIGRIDRIGQKNPVLVRFAGIDGSLHGDIMQAARRRAADNKTLFN